MRSREKGLVSLAGMVVISAALTAGSDSIYSALKSLEKVPEPGAYQAGTYEASAAGFGGDVKVSVTIDENGSLTDISVVDCSTETDSIGQAAAPELAKAMLEAQSAEVAAVSGATLTSTAVKEAVLSCLAQASGEEMAAEANAAEEETGEEAEEQSEETDAAETESVEETETPETADEAETENADGETDAAADAAAAGEYQAGTYEASAEGFGGEVKVAVTIDEEGLMKSIQLLDYSTETPDIGQAAAPQITEAIIETQNAEVEAVSGATMTSTAVKEAVKSCLAQAAGGKTAEADGTEEEALQAEGGKDAAEESEEPEAPAAAQVYRPGTYEAAAEGYAGEVKVAVTVAEDGSLQNVQILDYSAESADIGQPAALELTAAMIEQQSVDVDVVSGATLTGNAVIEAVQEALALAGSGAEASKETDAAEKETEEEEAAAVTQFTASAKGYEGDVQVAVVLDADGSMKSIQILDYSAESADIGQPAALELTAAMIEQQSADVDVVSGATLTSNAVIEAVKAALKQAE